MEHLDLKETNTLVLAYLGDAVWELYVREYFIEKGLTIKELNKKVKEYVNGKIQSKYYRKILNELDEDIKAVVKRAKNSNIKSFPKSCNPIEYREATAFEALIAIYYNLNRIDDIRKIIKENVENKE